MDDIIPILDYYDLILDKEGKPHRVYECLDLDGNTEPRLSDCLLFCADRNLSEVNKIKEMIGNACDKRINRLKALKKSKNKKDHAQIDHQIAQQQYLRTHQDDVISELSEYSKAHPVPETHTDLARGQLRFYMNNLVKSVSPSIHALLERPANIIVSVPSGVISTFQINAQSSFTGEKHYIALVEDKVPACLQPMGEGKRADLVPLNHMATFFSLVSNGLDKHFDMNNPLAKAAVQEVYDRQLYGDKYQPPEDQLERTTDLMEIYGHMKFGGVKRFGDSQALEKFFHSIEQKIQALPTASNPPKLPNALLNDTMAIPLSLQPNHVFSSLSGAISIHSGQAEPVRWPNLAHEHRFTFSANPAAARTSPKVAGEEGISRNTLEIAKEMVGAITDAPRGILLEDKSFQPLPKEKPDGSAEFFTTLNLLLAALHVSPKEFDHKFSDAAVEQIQAIAAAVAQTHEKEKTPAKNMFPAISTICAANPGHEYIENDGKSRHGGIDKIRSDATNRTLNITGYVAGNLAARLTPYIRMLDLQELEQHAENPQGTPYCRTRTHYALKALDRLQVKGSTARTKLAPDDFGATLHQYAAGLLDLRKLPKDLIECKLATDDMQTLKVSNYRVTVNPRHFFQETLTNTAKILAKEKEAEIDPQEVAALLEQLNRNLEAIWQRRLGESQADEPRPPSPVSAPAVRPVHQAYYLANKMLQETLAPQEKTNAKSPLAIAFLEETRQLRELLQASRDKERWDTLFAAPVLACMEAVVKESTDRGAAWKGIDAGDSAFAQARHLARSILLENPSQPDKHEQKIRRALLQSPTLLACMTGRKDIVDGVLAQISGWKTELEENKRSNIAYNQLLHLDPAGKGQKVDPFINAIEETYLPKAKILLGDNPSLIIPAPATKARVPLPPARPAYTSPGTYAYKPPAGDTPTRPTDNGAVFVGAGATLAAIADITPPPRRGGNGTHTALTTPKTLVMEAANTAKAKPAKPPATDAALLEAKRAKAMIASKKKLNFIFGEMKTKLEAKITGNNRKWYSHTLHADCRLENTPDAKNIIIHSYLMQTPKSAANKMPTLVCGAEITQRLDLDVPLFSSGFNDTKQGVPPITADEARTLYSEARGIAYDHGFMPVGMAGLQEGRFNTGANDPIAPDAMSDEPGKRTLTLNTEGNWYSLLVEVKLQEDGPPTRLTVPLGLQVHEADKALLAGGIMPKEFKPDQLEALAQSKNERLAEAARRTRFALDTLSAHYSGARQVGERKLFLKYELTDALLKDVETHSENFTWERTEMRSLEFHKEGNGYSLREAKPGQKHQHAHIDLPEHADGSRPRITITAPLLELDTARGHDTWRIKDFNIHYNSDVNKYPNTIGESAYSRTVDFCTNDDAHALRRAETMFCGERGLIQQLTDHFNHPGHQNATLLLGKPKKNQKPKDCCATPEETQQGHLGYYDLLRFVHDRMPRFEHDILVEAKIGEADEARHIIPLTFTLHRGCADKPGEGEKSELLNNCARRQKVKVDFPLEKRDRLNDFIERVEASAMEKIRWHYSAIEPETPPALKTRQEVLDYFARLDTQPAGDPPAGFTRKPDGYPDLNQDIPRTKVEKAIEKCGPEFGVQVAAAKGNGATLPKAPRRSWANGEPANDASWTRQIESPEQAARGGWTLGGGLL